MTGRSRAAVAAAVLAAAATLLAGCSGDSGGQTKQDTSAAAGATASPGEEAGGESAGSAESGDGKSAAEKDRTPPGPKVPEDELEPVTGSFTKKEKEYLADRVPKGTDPAAVLQVGQETCQRITRTAEHDRKAAISAIRTGEIANAESAITHLCPQQRPLLEAAKKGSSG
ncbi:hypothetical protein [Streptomyces sp. NPDC051776]|uniref:hypothetical protein n=1 Tax=Streptomyces sp. NPDC051776 TaxID=3155414 RepID=UPI00344A1970